ncbi:MAG: 2-C-methyl-D-erythritol 4-phosphate cytidylyltransferase [Deltaproteobacteria bacterium]|nr:2-C-methyl-D-erythritol 4-phosphate cytidylyltransferase [Deltaproteobacteria bacterium]
MIDAALLGGGIGRRFSESNSSASLPKQFQPLGQSTVFVHSLRALLSLGCFRQIVIAVPKPYIGLAEAQIKDAQVEAGATQVRIIAGGELRQDSSRLALQAMTDISPPTRVLIHDACRPYLSQAFLRRIKQHIDDRSYGAWVPAVPVVDTLKRIEDQRVIETVDRSRVFRVQTPQIFEYLIIRELLEKAAAEAAPFTDDASICEYFGIPVGVFEGDVRNIKLTHDFEMATLARFLEQKEQPCESELVSTPTV